ncbi:MAG: PEGA domain-containing protein [Gammaproteobacteria bacterium]|nr:PEGA domain-containing protein [Gammaproteobacteria bacterium]
MGPREIQQIEPARFDDGGIIRPAPFTPPAAHGTRRRRRLPVAALLFGLVLCALGAIGWFVVSAKSVHVVTDPEQTEIEIAARFKLQFGGRFLLRPGRYDLRLRAPGYHPLDTMLEIGPEQNQRKSFVLAKLPGKLRIESRPTGAEVAVDGDLRGRTPLLVEKLEAGGHALRFSLDRHQPVEQAVSIEGLGVEQTLNVDLKPAWADVTLSSDPAGAEIFVDEQSVGHTPLQAQILEGRRAIRVQLSGYKSELRKLDIVAGQPLILPEILLQPADAVLELRSIPAGASVTVNGRFEGRTPLELALTPGENSTVRLFRDGYASAERGVRLASGERRALEVNLTADVAAVEIRASPADAELFIDGEARGPAAQTVELNTRAHVIRIHKPGYVAHETTITPRAGIPQQLHVKLMTEGEARQASIKPQITAGGGQDLKLFRPEGVFMLGASRREPGRRANEALRAVLLKRPFYLSVKETTNAEFKNFDPTHSSGNFQEKNLDGANQPAVKIPWERAALFCNWLSEKDGLQPFYLVRDGKVLGATPGAAGYRLPTEAEWEWAARQHPGGMARFAWGESLPPPPRAGNFADQSAVGLVAQVLEKYQDGYPVSAPVGSFAHNGRGLYDLDGNVAEWVHDWYDVPAEQTAPMTDPQGPGGGQHHVIRGASWAHGTVTELRLSFRDYGVDGRDDVGFRIARYLE